jgi:pectin methylesterase-like acyl-CoA thioesterase
MGINLDNKSGNITATNGLRLEGQAFPITNGQNGQILTTESAGHLAWASLNVPSVFYVALTGDDTTGDGSITKPFKSIQKAVTSAVVPTTIVIATGTYVENIIISANSLTLRGSGLVTIFGKISVTSANVTFFDLKVDNNADPCLELDGAAGFRSYNSYYRRANTTTVTVSQKGAISGENWIIGGQLTGFIESTSVGGTLRVSGVMSDETSVRANTVGGSVYIDNCPRLNVVEHLAGGLFLRNIGQLGKDVNGISINSSADLVAPTNKLLLEGINLQQSDFSYGKIVKTGDCPYTLINVNYDTTSVFTGIRKAFDGQSVDILVNYAPTNYSPASDDLNSHLAALDTKVAPNEMQIGLSHTYVVSVNGDDSTGTGSLSMPFATIGKALQVANSGEVILVQAGIYTENVSVTKSNLTFVNLGGTVEIRGMITLGSVMGITMSGIRVVNTTDYALSIVSGSGHVFQGCSFGRSTETSVAINISGNINGNVEFNNCSVVGEVVSAGNGGTILINGGGGATMHLRTQTEFSTTMVSNCPVIGYLSHLDGVLRLNNVGKIVKNSAGNSVISTSALPVSGSNLLVIENVDLQQDDLTFGKILKTGTCQFVITDCNRLSQFDTITGSRLAFGRYAEDIGAGFVPNHYNVTDDALKTHLQAIDDVLASAGGIVTVESVVYVSKNGNDDTGTGTMSSPYHTVTKAVDSITDASSTKKYVVMVGPGTYDEVSGFALKAFVSICATSPDMTTIQRQNGSGGYQSHQLTISDSGTFEFRNVSLGMSGLTVQHTSATGNAFVLSLNGVSIGAGGLAVAGIGAGRDLVTIINSKIDGAVTLASTSTTVVGSTLVGDITTSTGSGTFANTAGQMTALVVRGSSVGNITTAGTTGLTVVGTAVSGTITGDGASVVNLDATSTPDAARLVIAGTAVLNHLTYSRAINYHPATPTDWAFATVTPAQVQDALDELAKKVKASSALVNPQNAVYVAKNGNDSNGTGTFTNPYLTIGKATAVATTGSVIIVHPGTYIENVSVNNKALYLVGMGKVILNGRLVISGSLSNGFAVQNMSLINTGANALWINNTTDIIFTDCVINRTDGAEQVVVKVDSSTVAGKIYFQADINATVELSGDQKVIIRDIENNNARITTKKESAVTIVENCAEIGVVTHEAGMLTLRNVGRIAKFAGNSIVSNAPVGTAIGNRLTLDNVSLVQTDGTYGAISKTGACSYVLNDVARNPAADVLTGTRSFYGRVGTDIKANYSPSSYNITEDTIPGHLAGIDSKLAVLASNTGLVRYQQVVFVDKNGSDANTGDANAPYLTIQKALDVIGATAKTAAEQNKRWLVHIAPGIYNENLSVPAGRTVTLFGLGPWTLGDAVAPTVPRNIVINTDGATVLSSELRPCFSIIGHGEVTAGQDRSAAANGVTVSGNIVFSPSATASAVDVCLVNARVLGTISGTQTSEVGLYFHNVYTGDQISVTEGRLYDVSDTVFNALVAVKSFGAIKNSKISGMTVTSAVDTSIGTPSGIFGSSVSGVFSGPANSFRVDGSTYKMFQQNGGLLGGAATVDILDAIPANDFATTYTPINYTVSGDNLKAHLTGIDAKLTAQALPTSHVAVNYTAATNTVSDHLAGIDSVLTGQGVKTNHIAENYVPVDTTITAHLSAIDTKLASATVPAIRHTVHVGKNGNNSTADGSLGRPYLTVQAAIDAISDATMIDQYAVLVGPGLYDEDVSFVLKPNVSVFGTTTAHTIIRRSDGGGGYAPVSLTIDHTEGGVIALKNIDFADSGLAIEHVAADRVTPVAFPMTVIMENCSDLSGTEIYGDGAGRDRIRISGHISPATVTIAGVKVNIFNSQFNSLVLNDNEAIFDFGGLYSLVEVFGSSIINLTATSTNNIEVYLIGSSVYTTNSTGAGTIVVSGLTNETAPVLGGDLDVGDYRIVSTSNKDIVFAPDGTGQVRFGGASVGALEPDPTFDLTVKGGAGQSGHAGDLILQGGAGSGSFNSGNIVIDGGTGGASTGVVILGGVTYGRLTTVDLNDNQITAATIAAIEATALYVDYSISRGTSARTGTLLIARTGSTVALVDTGVDVGGTIGVTISVTCVGSLINLQYTSTATGDDPVIKYSTRNWM